MEQIAKCHFIMTNIRGMWFVTDIFEDICRTFVTIF